MEYYTGKLPYKKRSEFSTARLKTAIKKVSGRGAAHFFITIRSYI
jgi:hypothetical protein